jgi:hypothetical protein
MNERKEDNTDEKAQLCFWSRWMGCITAGLDKQIMGLWVGVTLVIPNIDIGNDELTELEFSGIGSTREKEGGSSWDVLCKRSSSYLLVLLFVDRD